MLFIFSMPVLIKHLWQLKTVVVLHWYLKFAIQLYIIFKVFCSNKLKRPATFRQEIGLNFAYFFGLSNFSFSFEINRKAHFENAHITRFITVIERSNCSFLQDYDFFHRLMQNIFLGRGGFLDNFLTLLMDKSS